MHLWSQQSAIIWFNSCSSNRNSCGHIFQKSLMYSLYSLRFGIISDENIDIMICFLYGKIICAVINGSNCNLSGYKFTNILYSVFGRIYSSGKFLRESHGNEASLALNIWTIQLYQEALFGSCFLLLCPGNLKSWHRKEEGDGVELVESSIVLRIVTEPFKRPLSDLSI